jgi:hypothetical protein
MVEERIKVLNFRLNLHYVKPEKDSEAIHLKKISYFNIKNRLFFSMKDIVLWAKVIPMKDDRDSDFLFYDDLDMNAAVKRHIIASMYRLSTNPEIRDDVQTICQILYFDSEKLHFLTREILNFYYFLQYIKKDRKGRFEVKQAQTCIDMVTSKIVIILV